MRRRSRAGAVFTAAALTLAAATPAAAQCRFISAHVVFEPYVARSSTPTLGSGEIVIACSSPTTVMITIGSGHSDDPLHRRMTAAGGSSLSYNIFADPKLSQIWGDGFHVNGPTVSIPGGLRPLRIPIYAAIPPRQFVAMGSYGDELFVTLNF